MAEVRRLLSLRLAAGLVLMLLAAALAGVSAALAQDGALPARPAEIVNTAELRWQAGGNDIAQNSNTVTVPVANLSGAKLSILAQRLSEENAPGAARVPVVPPLCTGRDGINPVPLARAAVAAGNFPNLLTTQELRAGEPLYFSINFAGANTDAAVANTLRGVISSRNGGDREVLTIYETGVNTGIFAGVIQTYLAPPAAIQGDCGLSVIEGDDVLVQSVESSKGEPLVQTRVSVLVDPYGVIFDSEDGAPVDGVSVTLVDEATGQPAFVRGLDGLASYPSTVISGASVTDSAGIVYPGLPGNYRFPLVPHGRYRLLLRPPAPFTAPSTATPAALAPLKRPDGEGLTVVEGSYGGTIIVDQPAPVRVDVPLDQPRIAASVTKTADRTTASPGDVVIYTVSVRNPDRLRAKRGLVLTDALPAAMRLRLDTVRIDGVAVPGAATASANGGTLWVDLGNVPPGALRIVRYALEVRGDAREGVALNTARIRDALGTQSNVADYAVRISRQTIADRMTIIGRVADGGCEAGPSGQKGVAGVRVLLEDGSYAVTDYDGRYHFEGLRPGLHVVSLEESTLPGDLRAVDCARNTRSAGSAISRFVEGGGGALHRADFHAARVVPPGADTGTPQARLPAQAPLLATVPDIVATDRQAAGGERDWFVGQAPGIGWLYPEADANPRAPAVRIAIKYHPGQKLRLFADGKLVDPVTFEGERISADHQIAIGLWRGVPLGEGGGTSFVAEVRDADGRLAQKLARRVAFVSTAYDVALLRDQSVLVADGISRPVIALRITDRAGRPVHHGVSGELRLPAPYVVAAQADAQQSRQLAGLDRVSASWRVEGDEGIARIMLQPTTVSGALGLMLPLADGRATRQRRVDLWLDPGSRPWTIVGLAQGSVGYERISQGLKSAPDESDKLSVDGRIALYAHGKVRGKWLLTLAYDSKKREDETRFGGTIDPDTYYTIYADRSERRFGAASVRKLYLKLERPQFYALFGDYDTAIEEPVLARYVRSFNGIKTEYRSANISATGFAADVPSRHRRDELQGSGLSGPYLLGARDMLPNSETIAIEVRDRLRGDRLIDRRVLTRHIDYDIDYLAGTLRFREPILSRTSSLDPQIIVADYEVNGVALRAANGGGRVATTLAGGKLRVAATGLRDADDRGGTALGGADVRYRPNAATEIRAEAAVSAGDGNRQPGTSVAWLVEAEHHGAAHDVLAYVRQEDSGFGIGQTARTTQARRSIGVEGSAHLVGRLSLSGSAWREESLSSAASRIAARSLLEYRGPLADVRAGLIFAQDHRVDGETTQSTIVQLGATRRLFNNRLELDGQSEFALGSSAGSADFPARNRLSARFALARGVRLVSSYERARGRAVRADAARFGFDVQPWSGARLTSAIGQQNIAEYGARSFAAYGLAQSFQLDKRWSVDASFDGNRTLSGIDPAAIINPAQPVASGGLLGSDGGVAEDFAAITAGAAYRGDRWSWTGRGEYRAGSRTNRHAITTSALRQLGEGRALGALFTLANANDRNGQESAVWSFALSWANRPALSRWSWLNKLEARSDAVRGAVLGQPGPIGGGALDISGDVRSRRIVNSFSLNYSAREHRSGAWLDRSQITLFWGARYVDTRFGSADVAGWSNVVSIDSRFDLSDIVDVGMAASTRLGTGAATVEYAIGPSIGLRPAKNTGIVIGYNLSGFEDRDFAAARATRRGIYASLRLKLDNSLLADLGLR